MKNKHKTIKLNSWFEFKEQIDSMYAEPDWIFRGQGNANWPLNSSIERMGCSEDDEVKIVQIFKAKAAVFSDKSNLPDKDNNIEWLSLMQNHGAPTRLIDFTMSPYIAAYFAFEENTKYNRAVFCINGNNLYKKTKELLKIPETEKDVISDYELYSLLADEFGDFSNYDSYVNDSLFHNQLTCVFPVRLGSYNKRSFSQISTFLCGANILIPFEALLGEMLSEDDYVKFVFPGKIRNTVLYDLERMNISRATLFPDLDGFSKSLRINFDKKPPATNDVE